MIIFSRFAKILVDRLALLYPFSAAKFFANFFIFGLDTYLQVCKVANYRQRFILNSDFNRIVIRRCATGQAGRLYIQTLKTDFQRYRRKPVFACWDSVPNPLNNPLPGLAARSETERWYGGCFQKRIATNGD